MSAFTITIDDERMRARLEGITARLRNTTGLMAGIANILDAGVQEEFITEGKGAWAPLSAVRIEQRRKAGTWPGKKMFEHGKLASGQQMSHGPDFAQVSNNDVRAKTLHFGASKGAFGASKRGTPIPWGNIPGRPFMVIRDETRTDITEAASAWFLTR